MYVMDDCLCPQCKNRHRHPIMAGARPPVHQYATVNRSTVYSVVCHRCTIEGLSPATQKQYNAIHERIVAKCEESEKATKAAKKKS